MTSSRAPRPKRAVFYQQPDISRRRAQKKRNSKIAHLLAGATTKKRSTTMTTKVDKSTPPPSQSSHPSALVTRQECVCSSQHGNWPVIDPLLILERVEGGSHLNHGLLTAAAAVVDIGSSLLGPLSPVRTLSCGYQHRRESFCPVIRAQALFCTIKFIISCSGCPSSNEGFLTFRPSFFFFFFRMEGGRCREQTNICASCAQSSEQDSFCSAKRMYHTSGY